MHCFYSEASMKIEGLYSYYKRSLQLPERTTSTSTLKFLTFFFFMGNLIAFLNPNLTTGVVCLPPHPTPFYSWAHDIQCTVCGDDIYVYSSLRLFPSWNQD
jgi:hypothetical protein